MPAIFSILSSRMDSLLKGLSAKGCVNSLVSRFSAILPIHDSRYQEALSAWVEKGDQRLLTVNGISTRDLMRTLGINYPNAVSMLLWVEDDPDTALAAIGTGIDLIKDGDAYNDSARKANPHASAR